MTESKWAEKVDRETQEIWMGMEDKVIAITISTGEEDREVELKSYYFTMLWGKRVKYVEVITEMEMQDVMEAMWMKHMFPRNTLRMGITREDMALRSVTWKDTMNTPQALVTHLHGGFNLLMSQPGHQGNQYRTYSDQIPMARSLVGVKYHKPGGLWTKWSRLREISYDEWLKELPDQAEELVLEMAMLVMEDPTEAQLASSRVEDLVQRVVRIVGMGEKILSMSIEWWYAIVMWIVIRQRGAPKKEVAAKWLHMIQQAIGENRGGAKAGGRAAVVRDREIRGNAMMEEGEERTKRAEEKRKSDEEKRRREEEEEKREHEDRQRRDDEMRKRDQHERREREKKEQEEDEIRRRDEEMKIREEEDRQRREEEARKREEDREKLRREEEKMYWEIEKERVWVIEWVTNLTNLSNIYINVFKF
jgi:hypothetical protein